MKRLIQTGVAKKDFNTAPTRQNRTSKIREKERGCVPIGK
jgi:hypothetical protein